MKRISILAYFLINVFIPSAVRAQGNFSIDNQGLGVPTGPSAEGIIQTIVVNVIYLFFAVGGLGTVIYFIWGAVDWILSGGDKEKVSNARKKMTHAIIGVVLLALSFAIIRTIGAIINFDPLGNLQIRGLGNPDFPGR